MKVISYSLFGYDRVKPENCFDFNSYLRGLTLCLRFNRLLYPDWQTILQTDVATYEAFENLFKPLEANGTLIVEKNRNGAKLCEAMLWRLKPIFNSDVTHVLCRDLDSPATYREAQAVQYWVNNGSKVLHAITDSVSHDLPLLGGMIGIQAGYFRDRLQMYGFKDLMELCHIDLSVKGSDQTFLNQVIYPYFGQKGSDSITQHYFKGHGNTWLSDYHTCNCWMSQPAVGHKAGCPLDTKLSIPDSMRQSDECCQHIGSAGWNVVATDKFIMDNIDRFKDIAEVEELYPDIFKWNFNESR